MPSSPRRRSGELQPNMTPDGSPLLPAGGIKHKVEAPPKDNGGAGTLIAKVALIVVMGLFFGTALYRSRVFEPASIRLQFTFQRMIMFKVFMGAGAASGFTLAVLSVAAPTSEAAKAARNTWLTEQRGLTGTVIGAFFFGSGMAISGSCPGMMWAALGGGVPNAYLNVLGGLAGVLAYGFIDPFWKRNVVCKAIPEDKGWESSGLPVWAVKAMLATLMAALGIGLEIFFPWKDELVVPNLAAETNPLFFSAWPPVLMGAVIGLLQFPAVVGLGRVIGCATSFQAAVGAVLGAVTCGKASRSSFLTPYIKKYTTPSLSNYWQIPYVLSAALAALFWATLSRQGYADNGAVYPEIEGVSPWAAFIGAFIMLFSARAAGGCTSGHGISGFSLGIKISSAAVPAMFAGGIATAFALRAAGALTCTGHCVW